MRRLKKIFTYQGAWSVKMPNNYVVGFDVDSAELEQSKIAEAKERLIAISNAVLAKQNARLRRFLKAKTVTLLTLHFVLTVVLVLQSVRLKLLLKASIPVLVIPLFVIKAEDFFRLDVTQLFIVFFLGYNLFFH